MLFRSAQQFDQDLIKLAFDLHKAFGGMNDRVEGRLRGNFLLELTVHEYNEAELKEKVTGVYREIGWENIPAPNAWRFSTRDRAGLEGVDISYSFEEDRLKLRVKGREVDGD